LFQAYQVNEIKKMNFIAPENTNGIIGTFQRDKTVFNDFEN